MGEENENWVKTSPDKAFFGGILIGLLGGVASLAAVQSSNRKTAKLRKSKAKS